MMDLGSDDSGGDGGLARTVGRGRSGPLTRLSLKGRRGFFWRAVGKKPERCRLLDPGSSPG